MCEFGIPAEYRVSPGSSFGDLVHRNAERNPDVAVIARKINGRWQGVTATEFLADVRAVAKGLIAKGIRPGDRVAIMSRTRYEWTLLDFAIAADTAVAYSRALDRGRIPVWLRLRHAIFDRLVYRKLRAALGGRATHAISGGAALGEHLGHFYRGIGFTVLEGYGLTETCAAATFNPDDEPKIGTVGVPLPGSRVRIGDDGEILLRGPDVFTGYWNNPAATAAAFRSGWFATGDLGALDDDGYLTVIGRKKELIVTAGGKNVAPAVIELAAIQAAVDDGNRAVSRAEAVKKFRLLDAEFTEANGYVTPSLKLKRNIVLRDFATEIDSLYTR